MDHQTAANDREIIKDTNNFDMEKRIDEADLKIASVSRRNLLKYFSTGFLKCDIKEKHLFCSCNRQFSDWK